MALSLGQVCPQHTDGIIMALDKSGGLGNLGWDCSSKIYFNSINYGTPWQHWNFGCHTKLNSIWPGKLMPVHTGIFNYTPPLGVPINIIDDKFPHTCPLCGGKCYIGLGAPEHPAGVKCI